MSSLTATYRVQAPAGQIEGIAEAIALEQSVEVPRAAVHDRYVAEQVAGRVNVIREVHDGTYDVAVDLFTVTTGGDVAQIINMLFGNSSLQERVALVDVAFPPDLLARFPGPRFGAEGLRQVLGIADRPLTCAALKPQGLPVEQLASLAYTLAAAGVDVIKDDHGLADQSYSPFAARVAACQRAIERAAQDTGHRALYAPSVVGSPGRIAEQVRLARREGAGAVLLAPALLGMPAFVELVANDVEVPVLGHPAFAGATRIAHPFLLGTWFRMLGADATIFPHSSGRFAFSEATCREIVARGRAPLGAHRATLPVPAGGLQLDGIEAALEFYGEDVMLLMGGSLLIEPGEVGRRAERFVAAVRSSPPRRQAMMATKG